MGIIDHQKFLSPLSTTELLYVLSYFVFLGGGGGGFTALTSHPI
jgi:hypothetical protein